MEKVEVYKTSAGDLYEDEKSYVYAEAAYLRKHIDKQLARLMRSISQDYMNYYNFINVIGETLINGKVDSEKLALQYEKSVSIFRREAEFMKEDLLKEGDIGESYDMEPYMWGNDILCGFDVNR